MTAGGPCDCKYDPLTGHHESSCPFLQPRQGPEYRIYVCPVCREQVEEECGWDGSEGRYCHHDEYGGRVEPVEVSAVPDAIALDLAISSLDQELDEKHARYIRDQGMWEWWRDLPQEERERISAERLAEMSPMARAMMRAWAEAPRRPSLLPFLKDRETP